MNKFQLFLLHFRSASITTFFIGVAAVRLYSSKQAPSKLSPFMVLPLGVSFLISSLYEMILKKKTYEGEPFIILLKIVWDLAWILLALTTSLKLDEIISWSWKTVFFPLWIAYAILITATLVTMSIMLTTLAPMICCKRKDLGRLVTYGWINMHSLALCIILPMLVTSITSASEDQSIDSSKKYQGLINILIGICVYLIALLLLTLAIMKTLM